jgi:hypothetical protein
VKGWSWMRKVFQAQLGTWRVGQLLKKDCRRPRAFGRFDLPNPIRK